MRNSRLITRVVPLTLLAGLCGCSGGELPLPEEGGASEDSPAAAADTVLLESCPAIEDIDAMLAMERLDERALLTQCDGNHPQTGLRGCWNRPGTSTYCPAGGYRQLEQFTVGGDPQLTYEVT